MTLVLDPGAIHGGRNDVRSALHRRYPASEAKTEGVEPRRHLLGKWLADQRMRMKTVIAIRRSVYVSGPA